jgi:hypothetical protein
MSAQSPQILLFEGEPILEITAFGLSGWLRSRFIESAERRLNGSSTNYPRDHRRPRALASTESNSSTAQQRHAPAMSRCSVHEWYLEDVKRTTPVPMNTS